MCWNRGFYVVAFPEFFRVFRIISESFPNFSFSNFPGFFRTSRIFPRFQNYFGIFFRIFLLSELSQIFSHFPNLFSNLLHIFRISQKCSDIFRILPEFFGTTRKKCEPTESNRRLLRRGCPPVEIRKTDCPAARQVYRRTPPLEETSAGADLGSKQLEESRCPDLRPACSLCPAISLHGGRRSEQRTCTEPPRPRRPPLLGETWDENGTSCSPQFSTCRTRPPEQNNNWREDSLFARLRPACSLWPAISLHGGRRTTNRGGPACLGAGSPPGETWDQNNDVLVVVLLRGRPGIRVRGITRRTQNNGADDAGGPACLGAGPPPGETRDQNSSSSSYGDQNSESSSGMTTIPGRPPPGSKLVVLQV